MRVAEYAFQYARDNGRKRIAAVHKAVRVPPEQRIGASCRGPP